MIQDKLDYQYLHDAVRTHFNLPYEYDKHSEAIARAVSTTSNWNLMYKQMLFFHQLFNSPISP